MNLLTAVNHALALIIEAQKISILIAQAQAEGRDGLTAEQWEGLIADDDMARLRQLEAIATHKPPEAP